MIMMYSTVNKTLSSKKTLSTILLTFVLGPTKGKEAINEVVLIERKPKRPTSTLFPISDPCSLISDKKACCFRSAVWAWE